MSEAGPEGPSRGRRRLPAGTILDGRFKITEHIGEGGFATVYKGEDIKEGRPVAVKVLLSAEYAIGDFDYAEFEMRFMREAKAGSSIEHNNLATIYNSGFSDGQLYIAMEFFDGRTLEEEFKRYGPMGVRRAIEMVLPAIEALGYAHFAGIVHRDLKPPNLFISEPDFPEEKLVILDFGVAKLDDGDVYGKLTKPGQVLGTPAYTAPEALKDDESTAACDVYSMGLVLIEMLTGDRVVNADSIYSTMALHVSGEYELPVWIFQSPLGAVLDRSVRVDPNERFADCMSFYEALKAVDIMDIRPNNTDTKARAMLADMRRDGIIPELPDEFVPARVKKRREAEAAAKAAKAAKSNPQVAGYSSNPAVPAHSSNPSVASFGSNPNVSARDGSDPNAVPFSGSNPTVNPYVSGEFQYDPNMAALSAAMNLQALQAQAAQEEEGSGFVGILVMILAIIAALGILGSIAWFGFIAA